MKTYCSHKTISHRCITLSYSEIYCCAASLYKSNFFLISPQGCRDVTTALSPLPLFFFFFASLSFLFAMFWDLQTHASHVGRAHLSVAADFYFILTRLLCDNRHSGLSLLNLPSPLLWSQLSAFIISGKASERMFTHWDCVHSPQCFSFQRFLFSQLAPGFWPARAGW